MKNYMEKLAKDFFGKDLNEFFQIRDKDFVSMKNIWYKFTKEGLIYKNITNRKGWAISENTLSRLLTGEYEIRYVPKKGETYFLLKPLEKEPIEIFFHDERWQNEILIDRGLVQPTKEKALLKMREIGWLI